MSEVGSQNYRNNPDAWIDIPEFRIKPFDVNYEGFAIPVFGLDVDYEFTENLIGIIGSARKLAMRSFKKMAALDFIYELGLRKIKKERALIGCEKVAVNYRLIMWNLELVVSPHTTQELKLEELAFAASDLAVWAVDGPAMAYIKLCERNALISRFERPNARTIDHDEVRREFDSLVRGGHTQREARGMLVQRGNIGSQATIYRITKQK